MTKVLPQYSHGVFVVLEPRTFSARHGTHVAVAERQVVAKIRSEVTHVKDGNNPFKLVVVTGNVNDVVFVVASQIKKVINNFG